MIFPKKWLDERAEFDPHAEQNGNTEDNRMGKTNYDVQKEVSSRLIPLGVRIVTRFTPRASLSVSISLNVKS